MGRRAAGALLLGLGAAMAALPAFGWYTAPPVGAPTHASGFTGAGQLWLLPALGARVGLAGALQLSARLRSDCRSGRRRTPGWTWRWGRPPGRSGCPPRSTWRPPPW